MLWFVIDSLAIRFWCTDQSVYVIYAVALSILCESSDVGFPHGLVWSKARVGFEEYIEQGHRLRVSWSKCIEWKPLSFRNQSREERFKIRIQTRDLEWDWNMTIEYVYSYLYIEECCIHSLYALYVYFKVIHVTWECGVKYASGNREWKKWFVMVRKWENTFTNILTSVCISV